MKTIKDIDVKDKIVLVRVDYNVPLKDGKVASDLRIRASLPTIEYLKNHGAKKIILISHLGRPEGKIDMDYSLSPVAETLRELLNDPKIGFYSLPDDGEKIKIPADVKIALLENLRFDPREEANDSDFIKNIVSSVDADLFVQDGFAVVHRAHASTDAVKNFLPIYAGLLLENEVKNLKKAIDSPDHPLTIIIGGAKVSDKDPLIEKFYNLSDQILIGGKIAADGYQPKDDPAHKIYVAEDFDEDESGAKLDIGPISTAEFAKVIEHSRTIIWNGVLGYTEDPAYATASTIVATLLGEAKDITTIICGGDTTGFVENLAESHPNLQYDLVSTGGGAALEFLLGHELPGLTNIQS